MTRPPASARSVPGRVFACVAVLDATRPGRLTASESFVPLTRVAHDARVRAGFAWSRDGDVAATGEHRRCRDRLYAEGPVAAAPGGAGTWPAATAPPSPRRSPW